MRRAALLLLLPLAASAGEPLTATVTRVIGRRAAIDLGTRHGVSADAVFRLYAPVRIVRVPLTGAVTYQEEEPVGMLTISEPADNEAWGEAEIFSDGVALRPGMVAVLSGYRKAVETIGAAVAIEAEAERVIPGQWVRLKATGAPAGAVFTWEAQNGWLSARDTTEPAVFWAAPEAPGATRVSVKVVAPAGQSAKSTIALSVIATSAALPERFAQHALSGRLLASGKEPRVADVAVEGDVLYFIDGRMGGMYRLHGIFGSAEVAGKSRGRALRGPYALDVKDGKAYILDDDFYRIKRYNAVTGEQEALLGKDAPVGAAVDLAIGDAGLLYVLDRANRQIHVIEAASGQYRLSFGKHGSEPGRFLDPVAIGLDAEGCIYVLDTDKKVVEVFDTTMSHRGSLKLPLDPGNRPADLAVSRAGFFYVLETPRTHVVKYSLAGRPLARSHAGAYPDLPAGASKIATDDTGRLYVLPGNRAGIHAYTAGGEYIGAAATSGVRTPLGMAVASDGSYALHFPEPPLIECYSPAGWLKAAWGAAFNEPVVFSMPGRIAYSPDAAAVYVMGPGNLKAFYTVKKMHHVVKFSSSGKFVGYFGGRGEAYGRFMAQRDLCADATGAVWALDDAAFRVSIFGDDPAQPLVRNLVKGRAEAHELAAPALLAVDPDGSSFYIYDERLECVKRFARDGTVMGRLETRSITPRIALPARILAPYKSVLALLDAERSTVVMLDFSPAVPRVSRVAEFKDTDGRIVDVGIDAACRIIGVSDKSTVYVLSRY